MPVKPSNFIKILIVVSVTAVIIVSLIGSRPDTQAELQPPTPPRVITGLVEQADIQTVTRMTGKLQPANRASLRFEVSGNVTQRFIEPGQKVAAGDPLLELDESDFNDAVTEARAALEQELAAVTRDQELLELTIKMRKIHEREVERMQKLGQESLASRSGVDEALNKLLQSKEAEAQLRHSVNVAEARIKTKRAALNRANRNLERTLLRAPFTGTISDVAVDIGDYVSAGQTAVNIVQLDQLDLYLEIPGELANRLTLGQPLAVYANEQIYQGKVHAIAPDPDIDTHTHALRVRLRANELYPGQLAQVEIPGRFFKQVKVVPSSAVMKEDGKDYIFAIEGNQVIREPVKTLTRHGDMQLITGIPAGTRIVTRDIALLTDGQEVFVE